MRRSRLDAGAPPGPQAPWAEPAIVAVVKVQEAPDSVRG
jgi:hypothetical protein